MTARPARFAANTLSNYLTNATNLVLTLLTVPLLTRGLTTDQYGVWNTIGSIVLYLELLELGIGSTSIKYIAERSALQDHVGARRAITTSFWLLAIPGLLGLVVIAAMTYALPSVFHLHGHQLAFDARVVLLLLAVDIAISIPSDTFGGALIALQRYDLLNYSMTVVLISQAVAWAIVLHLHGGLVWLGIVTVSLSLSGQLARYLLVRRLVPELSLSPRHIDRELVRPYVGLSRWYAVTELSRFLIERADLVVVGSVLGPAPAAVYGVGSKLALFVGRFVGPALSTLFPHSAELLAHGDIDGLRSALWFGARLALGLSTPLFLIIALFAQPLLHLWVDHRYWSAAPVAIFLASAAMVQAFSRSGIAIATGTGWVKWPSIMTAGEAVLNLVVSIVLANIIGKNGVAIGTLVGALVFELFVFVPYICRRLEVSAVSYVRQMLQTHVPAAAVAVALALLLHSARVRGVAPTLGVGSVVALGYVVTFWFTGLDAGERGRLAARVRR